MWNKNERDGKIDQAKGRVKQAVGDLTADEDLKAEGQVDEAGGKVEEAVGKVQRKPRRQSRRSEDAVNAVTERGCHAAGGRRSGRLERGRAAGGVAPGSRILDGGVQFRADENREARRVQPEQHHDDPADGTVRPLVVPDMVRVPTQAERGEHPQQGRRD